MKEALKVFVDAAKETPALYFAPVIGAFKAASKVADEMSKPKDKSSGELGSFVIDKSRSHRKPHGSR